ncbi:hypothetical protein BC829DRAFT_250226 [Chytridium lagenaria]|nr:hypothetical protein BC829DRAFT_250226 [Chytridium lagenaria]
MVEERGIGDMVGAIRWGERKRRLWKKGSEYREKRPPRPVERGSDEERRTTTQIFLGNLPYHFQERDVTDLAKKYGPVADCTIPMDRFTQSNKGFCFLKFQDRRDAGRGLFEEISGGKQVEGRRLKIDWDIGKEKKVGSGGMDSRLPRESERKEYAAREVGGGRYD